MDVSKSNKTDDVGDNSVTEEKMEVDDPHVFGPFSESQLVPQIQSDADQGHYDSFQDNMDLLKTAIGKFYLLL